MQGLSTLCRSPEAFEADETHLLQNMTIRESVRLWLTLQSAFEP